MSMLRMEKTVVFVCGALLYGACELLWRGYTHISMLVLGGVCFLGLYLGEKRYASLPLFVRCFCGGIFITSLELVTGSIVNTVLGMNVWDYSDLPFNLYGQICLSFFAAWVLICIPGFFLCKVISDFYKKIYV